MGGKLETEGKGKGGRGGATGDRWKRRGGNKCEDRGMRGRGNRASGGGPGNGTRDQGVGTARGNGAGKGEKKGKEKGDERRVFGENDVMECVTERKRMQVREEE